MNEYDVIVSGAGPVGTVAAYKLANQGFRVLICEASPTGAQDLRASTFHSPTLEMLDELGVANDILDYGLKAPTYHFRERESGEVLEFDLGELKDEVKFPFRIQCEQHVMAKMITDRLEQCDNVDLRFGHRLTSFEQDESGVTAFVEAPIEMQKVRAKYLIAADGGNSITRKWLNVEFTGFTYPERFLCLSTKRELSNDFENLSYVNYVSDPQEWLVLLRTPNVWRILLPVEDNQSRDYLLSDEMKSGAMQRLVGDASVETEHRTIYAVHQRVATKFDHGRVCLVGDAAHLNNPLGGFGMNSGIHDAWNLCEKLNECLQTGHDEELLGLFDRQRRTVTHNFIQAQTIQNKELMEHGQGESHAIRLKKMTEIHADKNRRLEFIRGQAMFTSLADAEAIT